MVKTPHTPYKRWKQGCFIHDDDDITPVGLISLQHHIIIGAVLTCDNLINRLLKK